MVLNYNMRYVARKATYRVNGVPNRSEQRKYYDRVLLKPEQDSSGRGRIIASNRAMEIMLDRITYRTMFGSLRELISGPIPAVFGSKNQV